MDLPIEEEIRCDVLVIGTEGTGARASLSLIHISEPTRPY